MCRCTLGHTRGNFVKIMCLMHQGKLTDRRGCIGRSLGSHKTESVQQILQVDVRRPIGIKLSASQWKAFTGSGLKLLRWVRLTSSV